MAGLFSLLNVGASALFTEQRASTLAGQNIANAATPGYTRQDAIRQSVVPGGVRFLSAERSVDPLLRRRLEEQAGVSSFAQRQSQRLSGLEGIAADIGPSGLSASLDNFFGSIRELTANADDPAQRSEIVADAQSLATTVNRLAADFDQAREGLNSDIIGDIDSANAASETVARLNAAIKVTEANGAQANELRDERDAAVRQLSELVGAYGIEDEQGNVTVVANGIVLAQNDRSYTIQATPDASGTVTLEVPGTTRGDITSRIVGGSVGGAIDARDGVVADSIAAVDQFAFDLATQFNATYRGFTGLDGVSGRNFFVEPTGTAGAAASLRVEAAVTADPAAFQAATGAGGLPGDGSGATALVALEGALIANGGTETLGASARGVFSALGTAVRSATNEDAVQQGRLDALEAVREQVSGVSTDEQLLELSRSQRAYQAAGRLVQTVDQMLETVISLKQ